MSKAKKFGTFAGVFTPSFLSIVGVIMYLRLGWVVGEAGLINALAIILLAHIISIPTGLSISSIATDKKIKTGGIYYMLSRSLGLPMGGAIGITIFIAMSLNIALNLIGFAENFIGVEEIRNFFGLGTTGKDIRIVGTAAIFILAIIAYISTSLAVKSQFIILTAIILSLLAIVAGLIMNVDVRPEEVSLLARPNGLPFETIFAIFFPAATGFTVGVAMSGDLKDPKTAIPRGTMFAILVSLAIYLILAVMFAYLVDRQILVDDYNFLTRIALWSPLVIAGVWGATLSTSLGGIMGAPRVMQAVANDKLMPKIFGRGTGINNEPRNALLLTFGIAQMAILIGDLNVVARIASMFYMLAYGFINLSYVLESWASPDFRPSFRIPRWIGILGFVACFAVMFKLDALAMTIAVVLMFLLYFFLSKKDLRLDYGDVWQSVWSSIVRSSLIQIARKGIEERNWQPNIILFSGRSETRPHLIEFGKQLIGAQGLLSNFDLIQTDNNDPVVPRPKQILPYNGSKTTKGFFSRLHYCSDIYEGIRTISSIYGFSGIEPNTVMLGWGRQSQEPEKFIQTINYISALDLNIILLDYDKRVGFGNYRHIDIWWRTTEHNGNLGLLLLKFLWMSDKWHNAKARILIVNPVNDQRHIIYWKTKDIIDNLRIKAEIKIINNQVERRSFYDIVQMESVHSDLILLGLPNVLPGKEKEFVDETNKLCQDIGTVILIKASTAFKELNIGAKNIQISQSKNDDAGEDLARVQPADIALPEIPGKVELSLELGSLQEKLISLARRQQNEYFSLLAEQQNSLAEDVTKAVEKHFSGLLKKLNSANGEDINISISKYNANLWFRLRRLLSDFRDETLNEIEKSLQESINSYREELTKIVMNASPFIRIPLSPMDMRTNDDDAFGVKFIKTKIKFSSNFSPRKRPEYNLAYRSIIDEFTRQRANALHLDLLKIWGNISTHMLLMVKSIFSDIYGTLSVDLASDEKTVEELIQDKKAEMNGRLTLLMKINKENLSAFSQIIMESATSMSSDLTADLSTFKPNYYLRKQYHQSQSMAIRSMIDELPARSKNNQKLIADYILLELNLFSLLTKFRTSFVEAENDIEQVFEEQIIQRQKDIKKYLNDYLKKLSANPKLDFNLINIPELEHSMMIQELFNQLIQNTFNKIKEASKMLPEKVEIIDAQSLRNFDEVQFKNVSTQTIYVSRMLDYFLQSEFADTVQDSISKVSEKLMHTKTTTNEISRNLDFRLNPESDGKSVKHPDLNEKLTLIREHIALIDNEMERARQLKNNIILVFRERFHSIEDKLTLYSFIDNAGLMRTKIRQREIRKQTNLMRKMKKSASRFVQKQVNQYWYSQSIGAIFKHRLRNEFGRNRFRINDALEILDQVSISAEVDNKIPYFYKQLFVRKQYYLNELWTGREKELSEAERAVIRYRSGINGGIMVVGDHFSGKTFFSQHFINKFYPDANTFILTPPYAGSTDVNLFKKSLESALEVSGSYYKMFHSLPHKSVLIVDDLALWWEQTEEGFAVVKQLIELIDKYSHRCLFVINLNRFSYELMRRMYPIENYFLSLIELRPFTAGEMEEIILKRHNSTTLKLRMHGGLRENLRSWDYARIFAKFTALSGGNVGVALHAWLANIADVNEDVIYLRTPRNPDAEVLNNLKPGWYLILIQLMLHKRANLQKLARICLDSTHEIKETIDILLRAGIIAEKNPGVYEVNMTFYPFVQRKLIEKGLL